jgi:putative Mn2+ efflux pump MntP
MRYASIVVAAVGAQDDRAAVSVACGLVKRRRAAAVVIALPQILSDAARAEIGRIIAALRGDQ